MCAKTLRDLGDVDRDSGKTIVARNGCCFAVYKKGTGVFRTPGQGGQVIEFIHMAAMPGSSRG